MGLHRTLIRKDRNPPKVVLASIHVHPSPSWVEGNQTQWIASINRRACSFLQGFPVAGQWILGTLEEGRQNHESQRLTFFPALMEMNMGNRQLSSKTLLSASMIVGWRPPPQKPWFWAAKNLPWLWVFVWQEDLSV